MVLRISPTGLKTFTFRYRSPADRQKRYGLGHTWADRQITSVYSRWEKLPEMRRALERWASSKLKQIATDVPAKVVKKR